jgi:uncharacterized protein
MQGSVILNKIKSALRILKADLSIYLYGSRARGDAHPDSDWDLFIILNNNNLNSELEDKIFTVIYKIELETGQIISPYFMNKIEFDSRIGTSPFFQNISREAVLI